MQYKFASLYPIKSDLAEKNSDLNKCLKSWANKGLTGAKNAVPSSHLMLVVLITSVRHTHRPKIQINIEHMKALEGPTPIQVFETHKDTKTLCQSNSK